MSRYGGRERERERDRGYDRRRSVDVTFEEREERAPVYEREREFHFDENFETYRDQRTSGALVPIHQERIIERDIVNIAPPPVEERFVEIERIERREPVIEVEVEKKITEHEHEHHHRHIVIDHGTTYINAAPPPPPPPPPPAPPKPRQEVREREVTRVTLEGVRERRYGTNYRGSGNLNTVERDVEVKVSTSKPRERESSRHVEYRRYKNYSQDDEFVNPRHSTGMLNTSPRSSVGGLGTFQNIQDWTVVDVPPGTRKDTKEEIDISWKTNSVRRNRGGFERGGRERKGELWTEITKDLVAREALEEFGFAFEETDDYMYIFEYLHRDQIQDLIELSKDIRREKVKEIEINERRSRGGWEHDRVTERREYTPYGERDTFRERRDIYYT